MRDQRPERGIERFSKYIISLCCCHALSCALTGRVVKGVPFPGLKPWAESSCPFGTKNHPKLPYLRAIQPWAMPRVPLRGIPYGLQDNRAYAPFRGEEQLHFIITLTSKS